MASRERPPGRPEGGSFRAPAALCARPGRQRDGLRERHVGAGGNRLRRRLHRLVRGGDGGHLDCRPCGRLRLFPVGIDPPGGTAVARHYKDSSGGWITTYQRYGKTGAPESDETTIESADHPVLAAAVALSHDALILSRVAVGSWQARWLAQDGTPLTDWFSVSAPTVSARWAEARFLMDGSVVVGFRQGAQGVNFEGVEWRYRIEDGRTATSALPDWMAERPNHVWYVIRNGAAYAAFGAAGTCAADSLEVLAASGKSCGCLQVPQISGTSSVGRDGSLIVPRHAVNFGTCQYDLYPQLLK